jgi:predicted nucleic acid-binding protein
MVKALFDTNILIDYLNGIEAAKECLQRYGVAAISAVTWMEVMIGAHEANQAATQNFLKSFDIIHTNEAIAAKAVQLRQQHKMKLPDAIIWASAIVANRVLVSRNTKDFPTGEAGIFVPYTL